jgi:benzoyl-CoA reductase/2-hydroxyglutaryl-CoA dehydratase subunit BcrC/BadD/HgdB
MKTIIENISYTDPEPERISLNSWHKLFKNIPEVYIDYYRYYRVFGKTEWNTYLFPPSSFLIYGSRYLRKLKFDNSLASLRLWGFMLSESERLFRARQSGLKIVANMGDLGAIPPLVYSFNNTVPFYPDCYWWTPFLNESNVLFDEAKRLGIGDDCCFVRAALGAFSKLAYFPRPDLNIGAAGASCDDMAAVMQLTERLGHKIHWFELIHRKNKRKHFSKLNFSKTESHSVEYQQGLKEFFVNEFNYLIPLLEDMSGTGFNQQNLKNSILKINKMREIIQDIRDITFFSETAPLPALEIMNLEFMALAGYSDLDESIDILKHLRDTVAERHKSKSGISAKDSLRIVWVTPPADPLLLNYMEDLGGRLVGTEFVINQALFPLKMNENPVESLADGLINASLMGTARARANDVILQAEKYKAEGVIISNIFASSHCASETYIIKNEIQKKLDIPVLPFDVVAPGKKQMQSQIFNRMAAFMELLRERRKKVYV